MTEKSDLPKGHDPKDYTDLPDDATGVDRMVFKVGNWFSWIFLAAVLITAYEVVMRYVFNSPTEWVHETTVFLIGLGFTFSCAYALARKSHIRITLVHDMLPAKWRRVLDVVNGALLVVYFAFATYAAFLLAKPAVLGYESTGSGWDPHFPPYDKAFLVFMMAVFGLQVLVQTIRVLSRRR